MATSDTLLSLQYLSLLWAFLAAKHHVTAIPGLGSWFVYFDIFVVYMTFFISIYCFFSLLQIGGKQRSGHGIWGEKRTLGKVITVFVLQRPEEHQVIREAKPKTERNNNIFMNVYDQLQVHESEDYVQ